MLVEKAVITQDYNIILLLIDMSKAFDTVDRNKLMNQLEELLNAYEMRMMHLLIADVELFVRMGNEMGDNIRTNIGVAQGDCLSAFLFIFYLAHILGALPTRSTRETMKGKYPGQDSTGWSGKTSTTSAWTPSMQTMSPSSDLHNGRLIPSE